MRQISLFDEADALQRISKLGDKLEWLNSVIDWSIFKKVIMKAKPDRTQTPKGGRPPYPVIVMFKIILLQELYNVANDQTEYLINDRLSWKRFLGLTLSDKAPDATTIWAFREMLTNKGVYDELFELFNGKMEELGVITHRGSIQDASFVDVPRRRNSREENKIIKEGGIPEAWEAEENIHKPAQKDMEAAWTKKNEEVHFGYKDHVPVDADSKMITNWRVTPANVHDSQMVRALVGENLKAFWADSAYMSAEILKWFEEYCPGVRVHICEKGCKNKPLTEEQKQSNREKSRVRVRVEHVFGHMTNSMGGLFIRCIGIARAESAIVMKNLAYNISRYATLRRLNQAKSMA
jgi:IS5 family transposase